MSSSRIRLDIFASMHADLAVSPLIDDEVGGLVDQPADLDLAVRVEAVGVGRDEPSGADERRFLVMLDRNAAAGRHIVRLVGRLPVELQVLELQHDRVAAAGAIDMPAPLVTALIEHVDARRAAPAAH